MDVRLFFVVLRRHQRVVLAGATLAVLLALLSYVRPGWDGVHPTLGYREAETWQSQARVLVTVPGFPSGRSLVTARGAKQAGKADAIQRAEARLSALTLLYAGLVTGDEVRQIVRKHGPIRGRVVAAAETVTGGTAVLPIIDITALASSPKRSRALADRFANGLGTYVQRQQRAYGVPEPDRVTLATLNRASRTTLVDPRGTTLPIIVLLTVLSATVGLALVRENLSQQAAPVTNGRVQPGEVTPDVAWVEPEPAPMRSEPEPEPVPAPVRPEPPRKVKRREVKPEVTIIDPEPQLGFVEQEAEPTPRAARRWA